MRPIILALAISYYIVYWINDGGFADFMPPEPLVVNVKGTATTTHENSNATATIQISSTTLQGIQASTSEYIKSIVR